MPTDITSKHVVKAYNTYLIGTEGNTARVQMGVLRKVGNDKSLTVYEKTITIVPWTPFIGFSHKEILEEIYNLSEVLLHCEQCSMQQ